MRDSSVDVTDGSGFFIRIHHIYGKQIALETFFFFFFHNFIDQICQICRQDRRRGV